MVKYYVTLNYELPNGTLQNWSFTVDADNSTEAQQTAIDQFREIPIYGDSTVKSSNSMKLRG